MVTIPPDLQFFQPERAPRPRGLSVSEGLTGKGSAGPVHTLSEMPVYGCARRLSPQMCWQVQSGPVAELLPSSTLKHLPDSDPSGSAGRHAAHAEKDTLHKNTAHIRTEEVVLCADGPAVTE